MPPMWSACGCVRMTFLSIFLTPALSSLALKLVALVDIARVDEHRLLRRLDEDGVTLANVEHLDRDILAGRGRCRGLRSARRGTRRTSCLAAAAARQHGDGQHDDAEYHTDFLLTFFPLIQSIPIFISAPASEQVCCNARSHAVLVDGRHDVVGQRLELRRALSMTRLVPTVCIISMSLFSSPKAKLLETGMPRYESACRMPGSPS